MGLMQLLTIYYFKEEAFVFRNLSKTSSGYKTKTCMKLTILCLRLANQMTPCKTKSAMRFPRNASFNTTTLKHTNICKKNSALDSYIIKMQ